MSDDYWAPFCRHMRTQNVFRFANLLKRFGNITFRFSDTHGEMMSLETYSKYITSPEGLSDDSPLGIYDSQFGDDEPTRVLLEEYSVPKCFSPDIFDCVAAVDDEESSDDNSTRSNTLSTRPPFRYAKVRDLYIADTSAPANTATQK